MTTPSTSLACSGSGAIDRIYELCAVGDDACRKTAAVLCPTCGAVTTGPYRFSNGICRVGAFGQVAVHVPLDRSLR